MTILPPFWQLSGLAMWLLQFAVGTIFIVHGWPKLKSKEAPTFGIGGTAHGLIEVVGGFALIFGLFVREVALVFAIIMLGAIYFKKFKWNTPFTSPKSTGWEFDFILLATSLFLFLR